MPRRDYEGLAADIAALQLPAELKVDDVERIRPGVLPDSARAHAAYWYSSSPLGRALVQHGVRARPRTAAGELDAIEFTRTSDGAGRVADEVHQRVEADEPLEPDVVLVGCVKKKRPGRHPARDLYDSTRWQASRAYAEMKDRPWFILSAKYGLIHPDQMLETYDVAMSDLSLPQRREWSARVLDQLAQRRGSVDGLRIEFVAGKDYWGNGLAEGLEERGAQVSTPLQHMPFGAQTSWLQAQVRTSPGPEPTVDVAGLAADITKSFTAGRLDLSARDAPAQGWDSMPELVAVRELQNLAPSDAVIRRVLTFVAALDRARDADRLWAQATELYSHEPWVFEPAAIVARSFSELRDALASSGVSQRHLPDTAGWRVIAESLADPAAPQVVRAAVESGQGDASELLASLRETNRAGQPWFPYLTGPKVGPMWVRMLAVPGGAQIANLGVLPVAVDVQVRKVTEYLGVTMTQGEKLETARPAIEDAWRKGAAAAEGPEQLRGTCAGLDPALWFVGKWGCSHCERAGAQMPVSAFCAGCRYGE